MSRSLSRALLLVAPLVALAASRPARAAETTTVECLNANEAAISLQRDEKLRAAREQLLVCAAPTCPRDVRVECARRLEQVDASIPTVVFDARDEAGNDLTGVRVTMDGAPVTERLDGTALALDPGEHTFVFEAPGRPAVTKRFVLHETEKQRRERIVIPPAMAAVPQTRGDARRPVALVLAGLGIVGIGVGTVFGVVASGAWSDSQRECRTPTDCADHASALTDHDRVVSAATGSTVAFLAGGVALAAGAVLYFTAPSSRVQARVGVSPSGVVVRGAF